MVLLLSPNLRIPWRYTNQMAQEGHVWNCTAVWIHCAHLPNGSIYNQALLDKVLLALNIINSNIDAARFSLLVEPAKLASRLRRSTRKASRMTVIALVVITMSSWIQACMLLSLSGEVPNMDISCCLPLFGMIPMMIDCLTKVHSKTSRLLALASTDVVK